MPRCYAATFCLIAAAGAGGCLDPVVGPYEIREELDVAFVERDGVKVHMDIFLPQGAAGPRPAVLWVHGGGWLAGARARLRVLARATTILGYVSASADYRLTPAGARFPAQVEDVADALRFLRRNAERYGIDPERMAIGGDSAGAHLAMLVALCDDPEILGGGMMQETAPGEWRCVEAPADDGDAMDAALAGRRPGRTERVATRVCGVVNIYGPTDLVRLNSGLDPSVRPLLSGLLGATPTEKPQLWAGASPVTHVSAGDPPILTIHGDLDTVVPFEQALRLETACRAAGVPHELVRVPAAGHGWATYYVAHPTLRRCLPVIAQFLARVMPARPGQEAGTLPAGRGAGMSP